MTPVQFEDLAHEASTPEAAIEALRPLLKARLEALQPVDRLPFAAPPDATLLRVPVEVAVEGKGGEVLRIDVGVVAVARTARGGASRRPRPGAARLRAARPAAGGRAARGRRPGVLRVACARPAARDDDRGRPDRGPEDGAQRPAEAARLVLLRRPDRRRQDGAGEGARRVPVRQPRAARPLRHGRVRVPRRRPAADRDRLGRRRRRTDAARARAAVRRRAPGRDREGALVGLRRAARRDRRGAADRRQGPDRRLPQRDRDHDVEFGATRDGGASLGFAQGAGDGAEGRDAVERRYVEEAEEFFRPEFFNRIDRVVVFHPLAGQTVRQIVRRELGRLLEREGIVRRQPATHDPAFWNASDRARATLQRIYRLSTCSTATTRCSSARPDCSRWPGGCGRDGIARGSPRSRGRSQRWTTSWSCSGSSSPERPRAARAAPSSSGSSRRQGRGLGCAARGDVRRLGRAHRARREAGGGQVAGARRSAARRRSTCSPARPGCAATCCPTGRRARAGGRRGARHAPQPAEDGRGIVVRVYEEASAASSATRARASGRATSRRCWTTAGSTRS